MEVQTIQPRKLKRKATKEATNQKSPLHWTAPAVLLSLGTSYIWMDSSTSASSYKVNTLYWVCTTCKGVDWLRAKFSSLFQSPSWLFFSSWGWDGAVGFFVLPLLGAFGIFRNTLRTPTYTHPHMTSPWRRSHSWDLPLPTHHTSLLLLPPGSHSATISLKVFVLVKPLWVTGNRNSPQTREKKFLEIMQLG